MTLNIPGYSIIFFVRMFLFPLFCPCESFYLCIPLLFSHRTYSYGTVCGGIYIENPCCVMKREKYTVDIAIFFSSPGQKGQSRYFNHLASIIVCKHFTLQTWEICYLCGPEQFIGFLFHLIYFLLINHLWDRIFYYMV